MNLIKDSLLRFVTSDNASHPSIIVVGIRDQNNLSMVGKPMLLLNTLLSFAIMSVAILMRISALQVLSLDKVAPLAISMFARSCSSLLLPSDI